MELCERVKMIREDLGKTQKQMAGMVSVGLRTWQQYEEGVHDPSWKVVIQLAELGYNTNWLASGKGEMKRETPVDRGSFAETVRNFNPSHDEVEEKLGNITSENVDRMQKLSSLVMEVKPSYTIKREQPHAWFHEWIEEELQGKSITEIMTTAVKIKAVLDEGRGK